MMLHNLTTTSKRSRHTSAEQLVGFHYSYYASKIQRTWLDIILYYVEIAYLIRSQHLARWPTSSKQQEIISKDDN